jgi:hypothetical protein
MGLQIENKAENDYFDSLPASTQATVSELIKEALDSNYDCYDREVEQIECRSRSGFVPYSHNHGGMEIVTFTDLAYFWGGGHSVAHAEADKEIQRQIAVSFEFHSEHIFDKYKELLTSKGVLVSQCNYHDLTELVKSDDDLAEVARECESTEMDFISGVESSIMMRIRFMYHGLVDGKHNATVSCAVNTEGPYHRSHISWAPKVFCEGSESVELAWSTDGELNKTLKAALKKLTTEVF